MDFPSLLRSGFSFLLHASLCKTESPLRRCSSFAICAFFSQSKCSFEKAFITSPTYSDDITHFSFSFFFSFSIDDTLFVRKKLMRNALRKEHTGARNEYRLKMHSSFFLSTIVSYYQGSDWLVMPHAIITKRTKRVIKMHH